MKRYLIFGLFIPFILFGNIQLYCNFDSMPPYSVSGDDV